MLFALVYLLLRRVVWLTAGSSNELNAEVELVVLRHQLQVLKRQVGRPRLRRRDRVFMAAISRILWDKETRSGRRFWSVAGTLMVSARTNRWV